jgi:hypothetical protein
MSKRLVAIEDPTRPSTSVRVTGVLANDIAALCFPEDCYLDIIWYMIRTSGSKLTAASR